MSGGYVPMRRIRNVALLQPQRLHADGTGESSLAALRARHPEIQFFRAPFEVPARAPDREGRVPNDVRAALADADVIVCLDLPRPVAELARRLRWVQAVSTGVEHLPLDELRRAGVSLSQASGTAAPEIAEFVFARILEHHKRLPVLAEAATRRSWTTLHGESVAGIPLGLLGYGPINRRVAALATAFGMEVHVCRRDPTGVPSGVHRVYGPGELTTMLGACEVVVSALPETPRTIGILGAGAFNSMCLGTFLVNVGRGSAVDEVALLAALDSGRVAAAALDVFAVEPLPKTHPFWTHPDIRVSAHCSSVPQVSIERVMELFNENVHRWSDGLPLRNEV